MKKNITIKDIAIKAGVSVGTVDRVIHDRGNVSTPKRERILQVMEELGYERNLLASTLALNKNFKIAILLPDPSVDPYWEDPLAGVYNALESIKHFGVTSQIYTFDLFDSSSFSEMSNQLFESNPDAILFAPLFINESKQLLQKSKELGIPNVMINTHIENIDSLSYVGPDSYQSGILAGRLLNDFYNEDVTVLILNLSKGSSHAQHLLEKERGFRAYYINAMMDNVNVIKYDFEDFDNDQLMKSFIQRIIVKHPKLMGLFVTNSRLYRVVDALNTFQTKRIKMVGFDLIDKNIEYLKTDRINFLINQNSVQQGHTGIMTLFNRFILKQEVANIQNLPLDIVVQENYFYYLKKEKTFLRTMF